MATAPLEVIEDTKGADALQEVSKAAHLLQPINEEEALREGRATALHRAIRDVESEEALSLLTLSGQRAGHVMLDRHLPQRAKSLLKSAPWSISAWMLSRAMSQQSWIFTGSGVFAVADGMRFEIRGNPFVRHETGGRKLCAFHAAMFETVYRALVDPRLVCAETSCEGAGDDACRFAFGLAEDHQ